MDERTQAALAPPWPDLLIVAGRRVAAAARWVREQSRGKTLVVAIGAMAGTPAEGVDLAVTRKGASLFPHPHRFEIEAPLVSASSSERGSARWHERISRIRGPRIALLVGSGTRRLGLDAASAEALGRLVAESAAGLGATILVSASRHASRAVLEGCLRGVGRPAIVHRETTDQLPEERAWPAIVRSADIFVLAGLGDTTLAEICATGRPVFISPKLRSSQSLWSRFRDGIAAAVIAQAEARPANDRGTTRPQEGLPLLCARWISRGLVHARRDVEALRSRFVRNGHARLLRAPIRAGDLEGFAPAPARDVDAVAERVRLMFGLEVNEELGNNETNSV